jgi:hypothetical protein
MRKNDSHPFYHLDDFFKVVNISKVTNYKHLITFLLIFMQAAPLAASVQSDRRRNFGLALPFRVLYFQVSQDAVAVKVPKSLERLCPYASMTPGCP